MRKFTGWLGMVVCAAVLSACGGGGGSPGTNSNGVAPSKAASVVLTASATTIASSGLAGTEVTLTAIVKDGGGNALAVTVILRSELSPLTLSFSTTSPAAGPRAR